MSHKSHPDEIIRISIADFFAHPIEYFILAILTLRAFLSVQNPPFKKKAFRYAMLFCFLYGISDEIHQAFIPGRTPSLTDVFYDSVGIIIAGFVFKAMRRMH